MSREVERLSEGALFEYLTGVVRGTGMRLVIEERGDEWFAEAGARSGLGGWMVVNGANGPDRRTAMLRLARMFADPR